MQIIGRLAGEPELTNTSTGKELVRFTVAANYGTREEPKTSWFRIASFDTGPRRDYLLGLPKGYVLLFAFLGFFLLFCFLDTQKEATNPRGGEQLG